MHNDDELLDEDEVDPSLWKLVAESILDDMNVDDADKGAKNLLSLVIQQETRKLVQSTLKASTERQASNQPPRQTQKTPSIADARVAIHDYVENSHFHPHLIEDDVRCLTRLVNSQPFPDTLQNPSVCLSFNLSAPLWKLGDDDTVESQTKNKKAE